MFLHRPARRPPRPPPMSIFRPSLSPEARGRVRRVYLFVVTSSAVCLFGLLFLPQTYVTETRVSVDIEQRFSGRTHEQVTDAFNRWVANDANVRRAAEVVIVDRKANLDDELGLDSIASRPMPTAYASWSFHPKLASGDAADSLTLNISCSTDLLGWDSPADVAALVNQLAQLYVEDQSARHTATAEERYRAADSLRQIEQSVLDDAQNALKRFEQKVANDGRRRLPTQQVETVVSPEPKVEPKTDPTTESIQQLQQAAKNPSWVEIQRELAGLRQRRVALLVDLTEAHPRVLKLDDKITRVEQRLKVTPLYLMVDAPAPAPPVMADDPPTPKPPVASLAPPLEDSQELRRIAQVRAHLQHSVGTARQRFEAAEQKLLAADEGLSRARQVSPARIAQPAAAPAPVEPNSPGGTLAILGCVALVVGGGVFVQGVRVDPTLRTADEVERALSLPVVGMLAVDHRADAKPPIAAPPGWTRRLSRGAELFLFVFALMSMGLAIADSGFAARCWSDPVRAPSYAVRRAVTVLCGIPAEPVAPEIYGSIVLSTEY